MNQFESAEPLANPALESEAAVLPHHAFWVEPASPHTAREMRRSTVSPATRQARSWAVAASLCFVALTIVDVSYRLHLWRFLAGPATLAGVIIFLLKSNPYLQLTDEERAQLDEFEGKDRWIVELTLLQDHTVTGRDRGLLWIEHGKASFLGAYTSFSIGRSDIVSMEEASVPLTGLRGTTTLKLRQALCEPIWASFEPVPERPKSFLELLRLAQIKRRADMNISIRNGLNTRLMHVNGQLPPVANGPGRPTYASMVVWALGTWLGQIVGYAMSVGLILFYVHQFLPGVSPTIFWGIYVCSTLQGHLPPRLKAIVGRIKRDLRDWRRRRRARARG